MFADGWTEKLARTYRRGVELLHGPEADRSALTEKH